MRKDDIISYLEKLNLKLNQRGVKGEIVVVGGAAMCLAFNARQSTKDIDCLMEPSKFVREAAHEVAEENGLSKDWINDSVKGFLEQFGKSDEILKLSNLRVSVPPAEFILAMKAISARHDTKDGDDVRFLIKLLGLKSSKEVCDIVEKYYKRGRIEAKTLFFIEEIFEED